MVETPIMATATEAGTGRTRQIRLEDMGFRGDTVTRVDGDVWFVAGGIPGEEVIAEVVKRDRRFTYAWVTDVVQASPHRVAPPCPYFGRCGGCQWQHIAYPYQLELKTDLVRRQLQRRGEFEQPPVQPTIGMAEPWHYRNQVRFSVNRRGELGFNTHFGNRFLPIAKCRIAQPKINAVLEALQGRAGGVKHQLVVRAGLHSGDLMVFPAVPEADVAFETGQRHFYEVLHGHTFQAFNSSFFQTNTRQAERLATLVQTQLSLTGGEVVIDAYSGVGTFAVMLAEQARRVIAIEESATAIADARRNIEGYDNIELVEAKTEAALPQLHLGVDAVILDPSRAGCQPEVLEAVRELRPTQVIYVSCDPYTLARDLRQLVDGGFELLNIQPLDMFPHTYHVESVSTLHLQ